MNSPLLAIDIQSPDGEYVCIQVEHWTRSIIIIIIQINETIAITVYIGYYSFEIYIIKL